MRRLLFYVLYEGFVRALWRGLYLFYISKSKSMLYLINTSFVLYNNFLNGLWQKNFIAYGTNEFYRHLLKFSFSDVLLDYICYWIYLIIMKYSRRVYIERWIFFEYMNFLPKLFEVRVSISILFLSLLSI